MKRITLLFLSFIFSLSLSCCSQEVALDKMFFEITGNVKTMTLSRELYDGQTAKSIYYFNKKGQLEKVENYNYFYNDEVRIGEKTLFKDEKRGVRTYQIIEVDSDETEKIVGYYSLELISPNVLKHIVKITDVEIEKIIYFNENSFIKEVITKGSVREIPTNYKLEHFYTENNELEYAIVTNTDTSETAKNIVQNIQKDKVGNITYAEHIDETGNITHKIVSSFTYY